MRIALVHDYIKEFGGAERVLEALHEIWPKAPVFTTIYLPKFLGPHRRRIEKWDIRPSFLQTIPMKGKLLSPFRFIGPLIFKSMDLSKYDIVIVSAAGTYTSPNFIKTGVKTLHICYYHTPPRYLYGYATAAPWGEVWWRKTLYFFGQVPMHFLRMADFKAAQRPDYLITNSKEVAARVNKFYRRKAKVIYPPVDIPKLGQRLMVKGQRSYYIAGGRIARPKRIDLAVKACTKLGHPLKVFGRHFAGYGDELKEMAGPTIEFLGEVTDKEKWELMAGAKALIFPAEEEDFGITPVEAMAVGTPVIALRSGGVVESVAEGKTGVFFDPPSHKATGGQGDPMVDSLVKAIKRFERTKIRPEDCINQAKKFNKERFKREMREFVNKVAG